MKEDIRQEQTKLTEMVANVLKQAKAKGASAAEVAVSQDNGFTVNVRMGEIDTLEHHRDKAIGITVYFGQQKGSASTSDTEEKSLEAALEKACNIAKYTGSDPFAGLADEKLMAYNYSDLDLYHPWNVTPAEAIEIAKECETMGRSIDKRITNSEGATVSSHESVVVYGNSHGFIGGFPGTNHGITLVLIANDGKTMQRDHSYTVARDGLDLDPIAKIAKEAAHKAVNRLNARRLTTRKVPVIFHAEIAGGLIGNLIAAIRGSNLYRKASFLLDHLGKQVLPKNIVLTEKPHIKKGLASAPFDSEGVYTSEHEIVKDGILKSYVLSSYSARKLGLQTTGNASGIHNLIINTSDKDFAGLLKEMNTGLLITEMIGQGINIVTGDYSRGASGFWVENGEIQYPVEEITVAGNLKNMLANIVSVGNDVDRRGNIRTGSILIEEMMVAGE